MNTYTLNLSSPSTNYVFANPLLEFEDHTRLTLTLDSVNEVILPVFLKIDWGDGTSESFDNDLFQQGRTKVNIFRFSSILTETYSKDYYPSNTALYKSLTAQVFIDYSNGNNVWFLIPIKIRTYDYFESIYDLKLTNTNILPYAGNPTTHQLITGKDGTIIEVRAN